MRGSRQEGCQAEGWPRHPFSSQARQFWERCIHQFANPEASRHGTGLSFTSLSTMPHPLRRTLTITRGSQCGSSGDTLVSVDSGETVAKIVMVHP